ncbi:hypothetical protein D3C78_1718520 [compost metagenome]
MTIALDLQSTLTDGLAHLAVEVSEQLTLKGAIGEQRNKEGVAFGVGELQVANARHEGYPGV